MACPLPSQFENLVPLDPDNPTCEELAAIMTELPKLLLEWWSCWFREDGTLTDEFSDSICVISCGGSPVTTTTGGGSATTTTGGSPVTTTTSAPVLSPSAYWRMEETGASDDRVDATGNGNFLTAAGVSFSASGKADGCCELEGTLGINPTGLIGGSYSFAGWVYTQDQASRTFLSVQNGATLLVAHFSHSAGDVIYSLSGDATTSSFPAQASSAWAFVVVVVEAGTATMYLNGSASPVTAPPVAGTPDRFYLAINEGGLDFTRIDEWQLYNSALTSAEVDYLYNSGTGRFYPY
jgi:hypothetical protein